MGNPSSCHVDPKTKAMRPRLVCLLWCIFGNTLGTVSGVCWTKAKRSHAVGQLRNPRLSAAVTLNLRLGSVVTDLFHVVSLPWQSPSFISLSNSVASAHTGMFLPTFTSETSSEAKQWLIQLLLSPTCRCWEERPWVDCLVPKMELDYSEY